MIVLVIGLRFSVSLGHFLASQRPAGLVGLVLVAPATPTPQNIPEPAKQAQFHAYDDRENALQGPQVKAETVDAGKRISAPGVEHIEKALDDGWLQVARLSSRENSTAQGLVSKGGLDAGEAESLALAGSRKLIGYPG